MLNKRLTAIILFAAILLSSVTFINVAHAETLSFPSLGSISSCTVDSNRDLIKIHGSIKHSVLIGNRDSKIAVYRFDPWVDVANAVAAAEPCAVTDMSITFDFELPCTDVLEKTSLYAVALVGTDGTVSLISAPTYPDSSVKDTSVAGFKAIFTSDHSETLTALPGSAIIDVYLDKLSSSNNSGYIFNADGTLFYFDKTEVNALDRVIRSYTAAGTVVYIRYLISPTVTHLSFCTDASTWAANKCIVVDDADALTAIYAYTAFLTARYSGGDYGKVDGIILGKGADMPVINNYASLVSEDYNTVYARTLSLIGIAASGKDVALIVPITDELTVQGRVNAEEFLYAVADYVETYSDLTFTVMCESRHNPYGIKDEMFRSEIEPDVTGESTEVTDVPETTAIAEVTEQTEESTEQESILFPETDISPETSFETESALTEFETTEPETSEQLVPNTNSSGFYCTDNIEVFTKMHDRLKRIHSSINSGFAWCWYPDADTAESALGVCYSYNYMKLASLGADFYAVGFEGELADSLSGISHLMKYIDTAENKKATSYARTFFGIADWKEIIDKYTDECGVYTVLQESELQANVADFTGEVAYLDYSSGRSANDWYSGYYCAEVSLNNTHGCLSAMLDLEGAGFLPAEIGYRLASPEPLLVGDAITFDVKCGEEDGSLYEIAVYINHDGGTVISNSVVTGGVRCRLSADVSEFDSSILVSSIRILVKRITGEGSCELELYDVTINDENDSTAILAQKLEDVRNYLRTDTRSETSSNQARIFIGIALLTALGVALIIWAYNNDKKNKN